MRLGLLVLTGLLGGCFTDFEVGVGSTADGTTTEATGDSTTAAVDDTGGDETARDDAAGTSGGDSCPVPEPGDGSCPARCSGGCALGTCTIACDDRTPCQDTDVVCPQGWPCVVLCDGQDACTETTVHCSDGPCELQCSEPDSCDGLVLTCGAHSCNAWCSDDEAGVDEVECGPSCECQTNCTGAGTGEEGQTETGSPSETDTGGSSD